MGLLAVISTAIGAGDGWPGRPSLDYARVLAKELVRAPAQDPSCLRLFAPGTAPVYCRQNQPGARMIAVVGDSHAHVLYPGIAELAAQRGLGTLLLANSGCPPFLGAVMGRTAAERQQCVRDSDNIVNAVMKDERIVAVVLASRGPQYLDGTGFGPVEANYNYPPITTEPPLSGPQAADPAAIFGQGLINTATQFHQRGMSVSYVMQVPEIGVSAKDCLGRPLSLTSTVGLCTVKYEVYARRMHDYRTLLHGLAAQYPYLQLIDLESAFCVLGQCSAMRGDQLLYADDNHVSLTGSRVVAPIIARKIWAAAGSP